MKLDNLLQKMISFLFALLFFLLPLFFTPFNSELFEFNKIILVYAFAILIVGAWLGRMIVQKRLIFKRSFFDIPLVLFLLSQIASTIFSIDPHTSIFGYYSRFNGGLLSAMCYMLLYWAFVSNCKVKDVYKSIKLSLASAAIVCLYGILEHFGHSFSCLMFQGTFDVSCWIQKVQERVFATLGQPNWLAAYLAVLTPLTWWLTLGSKFKVQSSKLQFKIQNFFGYLLFTIYYLCLLFTQSRSGFLGFVPSFVIFWSAMFIIQKDNRRVLIKPFLTFNLALLTFNFLFGSPFPQINKYFYYKSFTSRVSTHNPPSQPRPTSPTGELAGGRADSQLTTQTSPSSEDGGISTSSNIRKIVWKGAIDIFKHHPFFGSGVETFAYAYYQFRPMEHNLVSEWDFLYNKAHNEYLNYLSTTGIVGLGTYLLFIGYFIFWYIKCYLASLLSCYQKEESKNQGSNTTRYQYNNLTIALFSGWLSLLVTNFFGFSVVITSLYFFLIPAFCVVLLSSHSSQPTLTTRPTTHNSPSPFLLIPLFFTASAASLLIFYFLFLISNLWRADYHYAQAEKFEKKSDYSEAYQQLYQAIQLSPKEPIFLSEISSVTASLALLSSKSSQNASATAELSQLAISYSDRAREISPKNLNILKTRVRVFYTLSLFQEEPVDQAMETMNEAIKIAPTEPKLVYNLGLMYSKKGDTKQAVETIEKSIQMKPNYVDARHALALFYEEAGEREKALEQLEILIQLAPENQEEFQKKIEKLKN